VSSKQALDEFLGHSKYFLVLVHQNYSSYPCTVLIATQLLTTLACEMIRIAVTCHLNIQRKAFFQLSQTPIVLAFYYWR
jgi:hypothetical protein